MLFTGGKTGRNPLSAGSTGGVRGRKPTVGGQDGEILTNLATSGKSPKSGGGIFFSEIKVMSREMPPRRNTILLGKILMCIFPTIVCSRVKNSAKFRRIGPPSSARCCGCTFLPPPVALGGEAFPGEQLGRGLGEWTLLLPIKYSEKFLRNSPGFHMILVQYFIHFRSRDHRNGVARITVV